MSPDSTQGGPGFLAGGGQMGALMRAHPWAGTPLGPPEAWPQTLRTVVRLMLTSRHPMFVWWGEPLTCLYNDAYSTAIGPDRHPSALGRQGREVWAEIWDTIGPQIELVMAGRGATWHERQLVPITRGDAREDVWWTYGYSPIDDTAAASGVGGVLVVCRDVTSEVRAEREAAGEAERLRGMFGQAPGFMAMLRGPDHVFELANAAYVRLVGREVLGRPVREALPEVEGQGFFELLDEVYASGTAFTARRRPVTLASGAGSAPERRFVDFVYQPVRDASGAVAGIFVEGSDVTEAALAGEALRAGEARQALLLRLVQGQRETADPDAMMLAACEAVGRHLGASRAGFLDLPDDDAPSQAVGWTEGGPDAPAGASCAEGIGGACLAALRRGEVLDIDDVARHPVADGSALADGSAFDVAGVRAIIGVPITRQGRGRAGMHVGHAAVRRWTEAEVALVREAAELTWDAVERARAAAARDEGERRLRTLVESIPQLVWRADSAGRWTWSSPQWTAYTGLSLEASLGEGWLEALHPGDREAAVAAWREAAANGLLEVDYRLRHAASGHHHWFQTRGTPVRDEAGAVTEWVGTCTDIDDQMQARAVLARSAEDLERLVGERTDALRQSEKLKAIGQLTGGIAHDFNNMLQAITASLAMIRGRLGQGRAADILRYVDRADTGARRAAALTHRLLTFARQQTLAPEAVSLDDIVRGMEDMVRRTVGPAVQVELKLADGKWLVLCDPNQMESALLNLCVNARDAMPDGGWLTISSAEMELSEAELRGEDAAAGRYTTVAVSDTGTGMAPEVLAHAFEPFFTTKPLGEGTGLGLSQIYGFVRQSGGVVQIDTRPGMGTTVRLCLPFHEPNPEVDAAQAPDTGRTILLVEDEHDVRDLTAEHLRHLGYRVLEADCGAAALRIVQAGAQFDLLVSDVGLPGGMNGRQVADAVRLRHPGLPAILMTGYAAPELTAGMDVLRKPFEPVRLSELVSARLDAEARGSRA